MTKDHGFGGPGEAEFTVQVATSSVVTLKLLVRAPDGNSDAFHIWFDDQAKHTVHIQVSGTQWITDYTRFSLSGGLHTLHVGNRESGTELGAVQVRGSLLRLAPFVQSAANRMPCLLWLAYGCTAIS